MLKYLWANRSQTRHESVPPDAIAFTYHENSAIQAFLGGFLMAAVVEAVVLHVLLAYWNHWVALLATASTIWFALQVIAQIRAVAMRPIYICDKTLVIRNGAFDLIKLDVQCIKSVELSSETPEKESGEPKPLQACFPALHNVVIELDSMAEATILNRSKRSFKVALLAIDQPKEFKALLESKRIQTG